MMEQEWRFREFVEGTDDLVTQVDPQGRFLYVNRRSEKYLGIPQEECLGLSAFDVVHSEDRRKTEEAFAGWVRSGTSHVHFDNRVVSRTGEIFHLSWTINIHYDQQGRPEYLYSTAKNVTDFKAASAALEERVKELRCIFAVTDLVNAPFLPTGEVFQRAAELLPPAFQYPEAACARVTVNGKIFTSENFTETRWLLSAPIASPLEPRGKVEVFYREEMPAAAEGPFLVEERRLLDGVAERLASFLLRREADRSLRATRLRLQHLLAVSPGVLFTAEAAPPYRATFISDNIRELTGYGPERFLENPDFWFDRIHPADQPVVEEALENLLPGETLNYEYRFLCRKGEWRWVLDSSRLLVDEEGRPSEFVGSWVDIAERKKAEEKLRQSEEHLRRAQEIAHLGSYEFDPVEKTLTWSDEVYRIFGLRPEEFKPSYEMFLAAVHPDDRARVDGVYQASRLGCQEGYEAEFRIVRKTTGEIRVVHDRCRHFRDESGRVIHSTGMVQDITERRRHEEELERVNRTLRVISRCNEALVKSTEEGELIKRVLCHLVETGDYPLALTWLPEEEEEAFLPTVHPGEAAAILTGRDESRCRIVRHLSQACRQPFSREIPITAEMISQDECCRELVERFGIRSAFSLALNIQEEHLGCLVLFSTSEGFFSEEVYLLKELADDLAYGIRSLRIEAEHRQAREMLRLRNRAIEASVNGIMISENRLPELPLIYVNEAFEKITGYRAEEVLGHSVQFLIGRDYEQKEMADIRTALWDGRAITTMVRNYRKDGTLFWNSLSIAPVRDETNEVTHFVSVINDVTDRKNYEEELARKSNFDELTGLANRNLLHDRLEQGIAHARRTGEQIALLLLDLDRFQIINDSLGHSLGNELLKRVAERLREKIRSQDTLARLGGDEFVIVLLSVTDHESLGRMAGKIREALAAPFLVGQRELKITASVGISLYPDDGESGELLLRNADLAMYRAKEEGRDTFSFFTPELDIRVVETLDLEADLRRALERKEFLLHFQPKVGVAAGRIVGCEALVRWRHPHRGMVSPGAFIPLAEQTGLIEPLGTWVLREACRTNRFFQDRGLPPLPVAVNVSARQFRNERLPDVVAEALEASGMEPRWLELELTESMIMERPEQAAEIMRRLKRLGVSLSLDDFGTGYSSLNYLRRFPVDRLKVDRSFISEVAVDPSAATVAGSVIAIAHNLGIEAVAEGVETEEQLAFLRGCNCDVYQGFLFSRPVAAEEYEDLLRRDRTARR